MQDNLSRFTRFGELGLATRCFDWLAVRNRLPRPDPAE